MRPFKMLVATAAAGAMIATGAVAVTAQVPVPTLVEPANELDHHRPGHGDATTTTSTTTTSTTTTSTTSTTQPPPPAEVTVTMIDTGVRATHQEFVWGGPSSETDQFVAWWDFSSDAANHLPTRGELWDMTANGGTPYDAHGHGTATASAAVGTNAGSAAQKRDSFCPGCKLAVAKVGDGAGSVNGDLAEAFKWARETVRSDVISMSIGAIVPLPAFISSDLYREIRLARQAGILVVLSNGNGYANAGIPGEPGFATSYANSPHALGVGASDIDGPFVTSDPEVVSDFFDVPLASRSCDTCYAGATGTSFSAPLVAGFAAHLKLVARQNNLSVGPDYLETLVKFSARDTTMPPTFEGYGVIDGAGTQLSTAEGHAAAGTLPARPSPDVVGLYVETVQGTLDSVWTDKASDGVQVLTRTGIGTLSPANVIGPSAPSGLSEAEVFTVHATAGDVVDVDLVLDPKDDVNDIDLYIVRSGNVSGSELVTRSTNGAGTDEHASFVAPTTGDYHLVVLGWSVVGTQPFTLTASTAVTPVYQDYVAHTFGSGLFL